MDKSTLEKAKDMEYEIKKLNNENCVLSHVGSYWYLFAEHFKNRLSNGRPRYEEIELTEEDARAMIELRKKRIAELEKELEQL